MMRRNMASRFRELIGRMMIDPGFLAELQRAPDQALEPYDLSEEERTVVRDALARLAKAPAHKHAQELKTVLLRRVAT
jgi:hypothetical protein